MIELRSILSRCAALFRRRELDERVDEELRFHVEMQTEENIRRGLSRQEARRQALLSSGGVEQTKESHRDARAVSFFTSLAQDLRFGARSFRRNPGFSATVLVTLALGIGVGTAVFSIVNAVLLKPLPYRDPDRLAMLWVHDGTTASLAAVRRIGSTSMSAADFLDRKRHSHTFENMAAFRDALGYLVTENGDEKMWGFRVSEAFFEVMGVEPLLGRRFLAEEHTTGKDAVIILQHDAWRNRFGADPEILGKQLHFQEQGQFTVVGVMPPGYVFFKRDIEFLLPLDLTPMLKRPREYTLLSVVARLKEGVSLEQAQAETDLLTRQLIRQYYARPEAEHRQYKVMSIPEDATGEMRPTLSVLFGAVLVVMLIVCSNVANLLLGRASFRGREMALRAAIGAGRFRLVRQLLTENLMLSVVGGAAGFGLAHLIVRHFQSIVPERTGWGSRLVQADSIGIDGTTAVFAAGIAIAAGILFGIVPALRASRSDLNTSLKDAGAGTAGGRSGPAARNVLIVVETALAVVLVCCAGLLLRSFIGLYQEGPGFQTGRRILMPVELRNTLSQERERELRAQPHAGQEEFHKAFRAAWQVAVSLQAAQLRERLMALPGVRDVALNANPAMMNSYWTVNFWAYRDGIPPDKPCDVMYRFVSPNYFDLMGIPIVAGRRFDSRDRLESPSVMVVSRQAVRTCWQGSDPIDSQVQLHGNTPKVAKHRVVGVVGDVRDKGIGDDPVAVVYQPLTQDPRTDYALIVHADSDPAGLVPSMRQAVLEIDAGPVRTQIGEVRTLDSLVRDSAWRLNYSTMMLGALAGLSLVLAAVGVYGVLSQAVRQRTREIGLRMALGADRFQVQRMILRQGLTPVLVGAAIGTLAAAGVTRFLGSLLFGVQPLDLPTFGVSVVVLLAAALLASYIPARRAVNIDPASALRCE